MCVFCSFICFHEKLFLFITNKSWADQMKYIARIAWQFNSIKSVQWNEHSFDSHYCISFGMYSAQLCSVIDRYPPKKGYYIDWLKIKSVKIPAVRNGICVAWIGIDTKRLKYCDAIRLLAFSLSLLTFEWVCVYDNKKIMSHTYTNRSFAFFPISSMCQNLDR